MNKLLQTRLPLLASVLVVGLGLAICWRATLGFQAFTWESYRELKVQRQPVPMPVVQLQDQDGRLFTSDQLKGQLLLVNFIYTRCTSLCTYSGTVYGRLLTAINKGARKGRVRLLSISLDPGYDTPPHLREYIARYTRQADQHWLVARPLSAQAGKQLLSRFGVVSIPDGFGGIKHNAAVHLIDGAGRLVQIMSESDYDRILQAVDQRLAAEQHEQHARS